MDDRKTRWEVWGRRSVPLGGHLVRLKQDTGQAPDMFRANPRARLEDCLIRWYEMNDDTTPAADIKTVCEEILDIFHDHPEAGFWYGEWRAANPGARLS